MFYLALMLVGALSFRELKVSLLPNIEYPRITVVTAYANSSPEEIENLITRPISESVGTVAGVEKVLSESLEGVSMVTLQFGWGTNIDFAIMEVRERVDLVRGNLPQDAGPISSFSSVSQSDSRILPSLSTYKANSLNNLIFFIMYI
jgi:multidrug efflux pump subunit AcrB